MAEPAKEPRTEEAVASVAPQAEDLLGLSPDLAHEVAQALTENRTQDAGALIRFLHAAEIANLIEFLGADHRLQLVEILRPTFDPEILAELDETVRDEVAEQLGTETLARAIANLDTDDALTLISDLNDVKQRQVLHAIPAALRAMIEEGLSYPEESAGRLMQRDFVAVPTFWTVGDAIDFMRESDELPNDFL